MVGSGSKGDGKGREDAGSIQEWKKDIIFHITFVGLYTGSNNWMKILRTVLKTLGSMAIWCPEFVQTLNFYMLDRQKPLHIAENFLLMSSSFF